MIKKIVKYGKILMALTLISTLSIPSYATVGASDGSAFVTKAEFDAALSDFNARLTTFEAGINSKIDSQVSSYLDRNGIWNGKEQTQLRDSGVYNFSSSVEGVGSASGLISFISSANLASTWQVLAPQAATSSFYYTTSNSWNFGFYMYPICPSFSKSGMCVVNWCYGGQPSSSTWFTHPGDNAAFIGIGCVVIPQKSNPISELRSLDASKYFSGSGTSSDPYISKAFYDASPVCYYNLFQYFKSPAFWAAGTDKTYGIGSGTPMSRGWWEPSASGFSFVSKGETLWWVSAWRCAGTNIYGSGLTSAVDRQIKIEKIQIY